MAEGFKIADGYVAVIADIDRKVLDRSATEAGGRAGEKLGEGITRGADGKLRDSRGRFISTGSEIGGIMGGAGAKGLVSSLSGGMGLLSTLASNPYVAAAGAAIGLALAAPAMAALSAGIVGGAGLGVLGLGALLLKDEPALINAATSLKDKTVAIFSKAAAPMLKPFVSALGTFERMMVRIGPQIETMFAAVTPAIEPLATAIAGMVEGALPGFVELAKAAGPFLVQVAPAFTKLGLALGMFASMIADAGPEAAVFFNDMMIWVNGTIVAVGWLISVFTQAYVPLRTFFVSIPGWAAQAWGAISGWAQAVGGFFTNTIPGWWNSAWTAISAFGARTGAFFSALPGQIIGFLASLPGRAGALFVSMFDLVTTAIGYGIGTAIGFFIALPGRIVGLMTMAGDAVRDGWNTAVAWCVAFPGRASAAISGLWGALSGHLNSAKSNASKTISSLVSGVVSILTGLPGKAATAVSSVGSRITAVLREAVSSATDIGADIIRGMINGINSMIGAAVAAAKRAVGNIVDGAKDALGISSPSKVMGDQVGRWLLPGITERVKKTVPAARRAISSAVYSLTPPPPPGRPPLPPGPRPGGGGDTYHFEPGSVVLDASKIRDIEDVVRLVSGINRSARSFHAGATT